MHAPRLMAVLAHPDDESLGVGGALAKYAAEGVDVFLLTATRGDGGRYRGHRPGDPQHPGPLALANIREAELRAAAAVLGVRDVYVLDYHDQHLDRANPREAIGSIVSHLRRIRPDVVVTFGPDGGYGHPDHIAISQFTTAAIVAAADPAFSTGGEARGAAACGVEALLHGMAGIDVGRLPGSGRDIVFHGRWRRAARDAVARLGDHHGDRHSRVLAHGVAGDFVPRVASRRLRAVEGPLAGAPPGVMGLAVVLSRVQHRERRTSTRRRVSSKGSPADRVPGISRSIPALSRGHVVTADPLYR